MRRPAAPGAPVVVKVGSSSLAPGSGGLDAEAVRRVVGQVDALWNAGHPTVLVTSGAVAAGLPALGLAERPVGPAEPAGRRSRRARPAHGDVHP